MSIFDSNNFLKTFNLRYFTFTNPFFNFQCFLAALEDD